MQNRLAARGPNGEPLALITGKESLEELKSMVLQFSQACPAKQASLECPFHIMGTLSHATLTTLVESLSRETCLDLFQMELDCRSQANSPCQQPPKSKEA